MIKVFNHQFNNSIGLFYLGVTLAPCKHSIRVGLFGVALSLHSYATLRNTPTIPNARLLHLLRRFRSLPSFCNAKTSDRFISETTMEILSRYKNKVSKNKVSKNKVSKNKVCKNKVSKNKVS